MWPLRWQAKRRDEVATRSRRGRQEVAKMSAGTISGSLGFHFGSFWGRLASLLALCRSLFAWLSEIMVSDSVPKRIHFQTCFVNGSSPAGLEVTHRLEVSPRTNFLTFLKAIPFQTGSHRAPRGFRPEGASKPLILDETCRHLAILPIILAERY